MSNEYHKRATKKLEPPKFDPEPSAKFAQEVLDETKVRGILIGRLAVWAWIDDASEHAFTKDLDIAIFRGDQSAVVSYLANKGHKISELSIGGINVAEDREDIRVDFIHRYSREWGDLSRLFEKAIEAAIDSGSRVDLGGTLLFLVPVEYLIAMKIATMERKDEEDAMRLLERDESVNVGKLRTIVIEYLGGLWKPKLENLLREAGHPEARRKKKYVS